MSRCEIAAFLMPNMPFIFSSIRTRATVRTAQARPTPTHQRGVSLIESLVALLVLATALLGIAGVLSRSILETRNGAQRAEAIRLVSDLAERIQLNRPGAQAGNYVGLTFEKAPSAGSSTCLPNDMTTSGSACTPLNMAQADLSVWRAQVVARLPQGDVMTFGSPLTDNPQLGVLIAWQPSASLKTTNSTTDDAFLKGVTLSGNTAAVCPPNRICHFQWIAL
jgi:type IV pilus assembly protein PilV